MSNLFDEENDHEPHWWNAGRLDRKKALPPDVHLPNKNEAKALRRIMSETGLTEVEVRQIKKYRKILAEASKKKGENTKLDRMLKGMLKDVTRKLKLPKAHPQVVIDFTKKVNETREKRRYWLGFDLSFITNADILQRLKMK